MKRRIICEHNRRKETCRECGGRQVCTHGKIKTQCKGCGTALCPHERWKTNCALCRPEMGYNRYVKSAVSRGLAFALTLGEFLGIIADPCHYCGDAPSGGVDRLNNATGYILNNSVSCCVTCNRMKLMLTETEFLRQVEKIHAQRGN